MIDRRHILLLLNLLIIGVTVLAVIGAFHSLATAIDDGGTLLALRWVGAVATLFLVTLLILLVIALAMREIQRDGSPLSPEPTESAESLESTGEEHEIDLERERRLNG